MTGPPLAAALAASKAGSLGIGFRCACANGEQQARERAAARAAGATPSATWRRVSNARMPTPASSSPLAPRNYCAPPPTHNSGAGYLIWFYLGVIDALQGQLGVISHSTPVAGASAGSIAML